MACLPRLAVFLLTVAVVATGTQPRAAPSSGVAAAAAAAAAEIRALYTEHNPGKLGDLPSLLEKYSG